MRFMCLTNTLRELFFRIKNIHMRVNLRSRKIRKIPSLVDFHSLQESLHSQVYRNNLKLQNYVKTTLKFVLMNDGESHIKLPKMFADKKLETTQKASRTDFNKKGLTRCVKNRCVGGC